MNNYFNKINICTATNSRNWADLPKELLENIGKLLNSRIDVFRYRAVCSSWRSSVFLSPHPPTGLHASISPVIICRLEHNHRSCLVKLIETPEGGFEGLNPLTIPRSDLILGKCLNLLECRLIELGKFLHFDSSFRCREWNLQKLVLFRGCGILAIYDFKKLGFRKFGDDNWTNLCDKPLYNFIDISVCRGEYYVLDLFGNVYWIDELMNVVKYTPGLNVSGEMKNLVESEGQLYVVNTYSRRSIDFEELQLIDTGFDKVVMKVYKFDEQLRIWVQVTSLNDRIFVLGKDVCFSVSANDFPGCEGNCIYYIDSVPFRDIPRNRDHYGESRARECITEICRPNYRFERGDAQSPNHLRYYDAKIRYYVPRVYRLEDHSMRDVEGSVSLKKLFSPPKECFSLSSTLSFP